MPVFAVFLTTFPRIWTKYRDFLSKSPYSVPKRENGDQKNSECGYFYAVGARNKLRRGAIIRN